MFKIEKSIPVPRRQDYGQSPYPFKDMQPGDSFFVPCTNTTLFKAYTAGVAAASHYLGKGCFSVRKSKDPLGFRIWRTK